MSGMIFFSVLFIGLNFLPQKYAILHYFLCIILDLVARMNEITFIILAALIGSQELRRLALEWLMTYTMLLVVCGSPITHIVLKIVFVIATCIGHQFIAQSVSNETDFMVVTIGLMTLMAAYIMEVSYKESYVMETIATQKAKQLSVEKEKSEKLLRHVMPASILEKMKTNINFYDSISEASVMFVHVANFEELRKTMKFHRLLEYVNRVYSKLDDLVEEYQCEKIKTIGSKYLLVSGCPQPIKYHAQNCALLALVLKDNFHSIHRL